MKVKDLLKMDIDIDVCDDYTEECYIAYVGVTKLTEYGKKEFRRALELECEMYDDIVIIKCYVDGDDDESKKNVKSCTRLFYALAGYCSCTNYRRWFVSEDDVLDAMRELSVKIVNVDEWPDVDTYPLPSLTCDMSDGSGNVMAYYEYCPEEDVIYCKASY